MLNEKIRMKMIQLQICYLNYVLLFDGLEPARVVTAKECVYDCHIVATRRWVPTICMENSNEKKNGCAWPLWRFPDEREAMTS